MMWSYHTFPIATWLQKRLSSYVIEISQWLHCKVGGIRLCWPLGGGWDPISSYVLVYNSKTQKSLWAWYGLTTHSRLLGDYKIYDAKIYLSSIYKSTLWSSCNINACTKCCWLPHRTRKEMGEAIFLAMFWYVTVLHEYTMEMTQSILLLILDRSMVTKPTIFINHKTIYWSRHNVSGTTLADSLHPMIETLSEIRFLTIIWFVATTHNTMAKSMISKSTLFKYH